MDNSVLIQSLKSELVIKMPENISLEELKEKLSFQINYLIQADFQKLVLLLYRIDVNETKLKALLQENSGTDAAMIIAGLIIERQLQKIKSRQQFRQNENMDENEKW
jgi:hypothetical protein